MQATWRPILTAKSLAENGLPLGLELSSCCPETTVQFLPGAHLTLLTDGVVEAQNARRELFGFDRTAAISNQSADSIARAAEDHGQNDDITVLTLRFAPDAETHLTEVFG
jgi:serine phosphatase RsbU (regulator of sigma subunit)